MSKPIWMTDEMVNNVSKGSKFELLELGGHRCTIMEIQPFKSRNGLDMWRILFDTANDDRQPHFYRNRWNNDTRADKKWSGEFYYIVDEDAASISKNGNPFYYGRVKFTKFTKAIEDSNPNFEINWGEEDDAKQFRKQEFCNQFKGLLVGMVFGKEFYNDQATHELRFSVKPDSFCNINGVEDEKIPKDKEPKTEAPKTKTQETGFMQYSVEDEGLPFNV